MERRSLAMLSAAMATIGTVAHDTAVKIETMGDSLDRIREYPESYRGDNYSGRRNARNTGKSYAITADPARAKVKAARKQSMKNRKKK